MTAYILRRLAMTVPIAIVAGTIAFLFTRLAPGDPAAVMLGAEATTAEVARLREKLHLDDPLLAQYARWLADLIRFDFGESIFLDRPVLDAIRERVVPTVQLTLYALALVVLIAIPAGAAAALHYGSRLDRLLMLVVAGGTAISGFFLGILLILVFAVALRWLPSGGYVELTVDPLGHARAMFLPALALGLSMAGLPTRLVRAAMLDVLREDYIRTAIAKGLPNRAVAIHALRNALLPALTILGAVAADLLSGAVVVETVFGLPGMGQLAANSIARRDFPVIQGVVMFAAACCLLANLAVDVLYAWNDPRIRHGLQ
jgi:peptide/nickel transport system permease protein